MEGDFKSQHVKRLKTTKNAHTYDAKERLSSFKRGSRSAPESIRLLSSGFPNSMLIADLIQNQIVIFWFGLV